MASLKELRSRKNSVHSTKKITAAMKMIAAAKLRSAQTQAQAARPYAEGMKSIIDNLLAKSENITEYPTLMVGTGQSKTHLLIVLTSDRGLCGGFNSTISRASIKYIEQLLREEKTIKILCVGRRGYDQLKRKYGSLILDVQKAYGKPLFRDADKLSKKILEMFSMGEFDKCSIVYNEFVSALTQNATIKQLIPFEPEESQQELQKETWPLHSIYEFEPREEKLLAEFLPKNLSVQIFQSLLESAASEQGARMTAMDAATRNAEEMIKNLALTYNRTRQAYITKELIEIISGAESSIA